MHTSGNSSQTTAITNSTGLLYSGHLYKCETHCQTSEGREYIFHLASCPIGNLLCTSSEAFLKAQLTLYNLLNSNVVEQLKLHPLIIHIGQYIRHHQHCEQLTKQIY